MGAIRSARGGDPFRRRGSSALVINRTSQADGGFGCAEGSESRPATPWRSILLRLGFAGAVGAIGLLFALVVSSHRASADPLSAKSLNPKPVMPKAVMQTPVWSPTKSTPRVSSNLNPSVGSTLPGRSTIRESVGLKSDADGARAPLRVRPSPLSQALKSPVTLKLPTGHPTAGNAGGTGLVPDSPLQSLPLVGSLTGPRSLPSTVDGSGIIGTVDHRLGSPLLDSVRLLAPYSAGESPLAGESLRDQRPGAPPAHYRRSDRHRPAALAHPGRTPASHVRAGPTGLGLPPIRLAAAPRRVADCVEHVVPPHRRTPVHCRLGIL